mmetsp:Transcript_18505/g.28425  ORF Transcript_18505/g.28425 Transcript_18505/m.28425 type:complete len:88 (-) Transcript_18505:3920-4183(-)
MPSGHYSPYAGNLRKPQAPVKGLKPELEEAPRGSPFKKVGVKNAFIESSLQSNSSKNYKNHKRRIVTSPKSRPINLPLFLRDPMAHE